MLSDNVWGDEPPFLHRQLALPPGNLPPSSLESIPFSYFPSATVLVQAIFFSYVDYYKSLLMDVLGSICPPPIYLSFIHSRNITRHLFCAMGTVLGVGGVAVNRRGTYSHGLKLSWGEET